MSPWGIHPKGNNCKGNVGYTLYAHGAYTSRNLGGSWLADVIGEGVLSCVALFPPCKHKRKHLRPENFQLVIYPPFGPKLTGQHLGAQKHHL